MEGGGFRRVRSEPIFIHFPFEVHIRNPPPLKLTDIHALYSLSLQFLRSFKNPGAAFLAAQFSSTVDPKRTRSRDCGAARLKCCGSVSQ